MRPSFLFELRCRKDLSTEITGDQASSGNAKLRAQVVVLLSSHQQSSQFLETPASAQDSAVEMTLDGLQTVSVVSRICRLSGAVVVSDAADCYESRNHATGRHKCPLRGDEHEWPCDGIYQGFMTPANHLSIRAQWSENRGPLHNVLFVGADSIVSQPSGVLNPIFAP